MKSRATVVAVSALVALMAGSGVGAADPSNGVRTQRDVLQSLSADALKATPASPGKPPSRDIRDVFQPEPGLRGEHLYIIRLADQPVARYRGGIRGLAAANTADRASARRGGAGSGGKFNPSSPAAKAYAAYLEGRQGRFEQSLARELGRTPEVRHRYRFAVNGITARMTQAEARRVARLPGVKHIERDRDVLPSTDFGPRLIGADNVWNGDATGLPTQGEGMVIGILDSGINFHTDFLDDENVVLDHPSFTDIAGDGYDHTNPLGSGVYLGDCETNPEWCNDKLIGVYGFLEGQACQCDQDAPNAPDHDLIWFSKDTDGHGSHVAGTAAGNRVFDVPIEDADGNPNPEFVFTEVSGVAPRANLVSYKVCAPSCFFSDIAAAVDQAINDGIVDALNQSIGNTGNPWTSTTAEAFLSAREAGIFVALSAGNSGPAPGSVADDAANSAPWAAGVAATTHGRAFPEKFLQELVGGDTPPPGDIAGNSITGGIAGAIVYAGDFPVGNPGEPNFDEPEQCLEPFPPNTFPANTIVLCDRGAIARVAKGQHVRDGGAAGFILGNTQGGATSTNDDAHVIPAIHIDADSADALRAWLASGDGHAGEITATGPAFEDPSVADLMADFSSRGPSNFDILAPNVAAPGAAIFAPGANNTLGSEISVGGMWGIISGTSMASPHVAGSGTLLKALHPDWTDAEVLSALMTTGTQDLLKEDAATPADPFDIGAGRVRVDEAAKAGLLMDESAANFEAADPFDGGDPKTLNVASLYNSSCTLECSWTRTVRATTDGTWNASSVGDFPLAITPESFSLAAGETQEVTFTADSSGLDSGQFAFAQAILTPTNGVNSYIQGVSAGPTPATVITAVVGANNGDLPDELVILADRDASSVLVEGLTAIEITDLQVAVEGLAPAANIDIELDQDSDNSSPYDDLTDGVHFELTAVGAGASRFVSLTRDQDTASQDLDLFVGQDTNGNGQPDADEEVCRSTTPTATEICDIADPEAGDWWTLVQNWGASDNPPDATRLRIAVVDGEVGNAFVEAPVSVPQLEPFDIRVFWADEMDEGDMFFGDIVLGTDFANPANIGTIPVVLERVGDDVSYTADAESAVAGQKVTFSVEVDANLSNEDRDYSIAALVPDGFTLDPDSVAATAGEFVVTTAQDQIEWTVTQPGLAGAEPIYSVTTNVEDSSCQMVNFGQGPGYLDLSLFNIQPTDFDGDTFVVSAFGAQNFDFYGPQAGPLNFTDDGFTFFNSTPGATPFINEPIPTAGDPNDLQAIFWRDFEIVSSPFTSPGDGTERGVTLASAGSDISIIEYDNVEPWPVGTFSDRIDFEMLIWGFQDDSPGAYEIIYAYNNVIGYEDGFGTIGVENEAGSAGTQFAFNDTVGSELEDLIVCYDLQTPNFQPAELTFEATLNPEVAPDTVTGVAFSNLDNPPGAGEGVHLVSVDASLGFLPPLRDGGTYRTGRTLPVWFQLFDEFGDPRTDLAAMVRVTDAGGVQKAMGPTRIIRGDTYYYRFSSRALTAGEYTITVEFSDGRSDSIDITLQ